MQNRLLFAAMNTALLVLGISWASLVIGASEPSAVEELSDGRIKVGGITVNRTESSFAVPGVVINQDSITAPMEFIAVSSGGMKSYEAVLELDTSAVDFNLACILIGLDEARASHPKYHFDPDPVRGDKVSISISYQQDGESHEFPVAQLLENSDQLGPHVWVYTGSGFTSDGRYMAEDVGTLIGFVHDPESIIQHQKGLGLGNYGEVVIDAKKLPPPGTAVEITVKKQ